MATQSVTLGTSLGACCCDTGPCCPSDETITDCDNHGCSVTIEDSPAGGVNESPCGSIGTACQDFCATPYTVFADCEGCMGSLPLALYVCDTYNRCDDDTPSAGLSQCVCDCTFCGCIA